jgi:hypothetical protein
MFALTAPSPSTSIQLPVCSPPSQAAKVDHRRVLISGIRYNSTTMRTISADDASQLVVLIHNLRRGVEPDKALSQIRVRDSFAEQVARGIAGYELGFTGNGVSAEAQEAAASFAPLLK